MAYQSLYRRYRSQRFSELRGQSHVTTALKAAVANNRVGHAYLFSGPRGTGKTSTARILAKALNCPNVTEDGEPCCVCESCLAIEHGKSFDVYELDAASNNKVDDIRDLISKVHLGSPGKTKVYILDEVHMLSAGAENALLKTLEEPPDHVVFVLATTEPHKVVQTIRSRTQPFEFHLLPADEMADHVRYVIDDAGLEISEDDLDSAVDYVLRQGGGSARDTLSALDLVAAAGGVPAGSDVGFSLATAIGDGSPEAAIAALQEGLTNGQEPRVIGETTVDALRDAFLASMGASLDHLNDSAQAQATELGKKLGAATLTRSLEAIGAALVDMRQAPDPRVPLEVTLLQLCRAVRPAAPAPAPAVAQSESGGQTGSDVADNGLVEMLTSRIVALERQVASLANQLASAATSAAAPSVPPAASAEPPAPPPAPAPAPAPSETEPAVGPASAARTRLAEVTSTKTPRSPRSRRPGSSPPTAANPERPIAEAEGAAPSPEASTAAPDAPTPDAPTPDAPTPDAPNPDAPAAKEATAPAEATEGTPAENPSAEADLAPDPQPVVPAAPSGRALTAGEATRILETGLDDISQRTRVRFQVGRVASVEGSTVIFAVPNDHYVERCRGVQGEIEEVLSAQFGQTIDLRIVIDEVGPPASLDPAKMESTPGRPTDDSIDDVGPVEDLADATDQSFDGVERLTKAFPGSKVIEPKPE